MTQSRHEKNLVNTFEDMLNANFLPCIMDSWLQIKTKEVRL